MVRILLFIFLSLAVMGCGGSDKKQPAKAASQSKPRAPRNYDALVQGAQSALKAGQPQRAVNLATKAAKLDPKRTEAYLVWGRSLAGLRKLEDAAQKYEQARTLGSRERELFEVLASIYDVSNEYPKAVEVYEDFLSDHEADVEMRQQLALTLIMAGKPQAAAEHLQKAVTAKPDDPQLREDLGFAQLQLGDAAAAAKNFEQVLTAHPKRHSAMQFLARTRAAEGKNDEALALLDQAIEISRTDPEPVRLRAQIRRLAGNVEGALNDYQMLLKANPDDAGAWLGASGALIALDRLDDATKALSRARKIAGDRPPVQFRAAQIAWRQGDKGAVDALAEFADKHPGNREAWRELVEAAGQTGNKKLEKRAVKRLAEIER